ncbi:uncharacterized protein J3R85_010200 [Psidium guajava]|nr:uncharacterized protein J3R85_010200 [Psidium guajava]
MVRRDSGIARNAWDVLHLALLGARRGGAFRRHLAVKFRLAVTRFLRSIGGGHLGYSSSMPRGRIHYGERQLSFDETPVFRVKMHRPGGSHFCLPRIPCINPDVDFNDGFGDGKDGSECDWERKSLVADGDGGGCVYDKRASESCEGGGIDERAEEFIAKFYEQMKLQRQISDLQYAAMLSRATS